MGLFEQFPYTNFHEANLDEIVKVVGQAEGAVGDALSKANNAVSTAETALAHVNTTEARVDDLGNQLSTVADKANHAARQMDLDALDNRVEALEDYAFEGVTPYSKDEVDELIRVARKMSIYDAFDTLGAVVNRTHSLRFVDGISDAFTVDVRTLINPPLEELLFNITSCRVVVDTYLPCTVRIENPAPANFTFRVVETNRTTGTKNAEVHLTYLLR